MKLTMTVDAGAGQYQVTTSLKCVVNWERKYKRKASDLAQGVSMEDLAYLAYEASKLAGITVPIVFDDFIDSLVSLEVEEDTPAVNP
jgi:hypothetical protein